MKSFAGSSSGGIDVLRPVHICDLISDWTAEVGIRLLDSISTLINLFLSGQLSYYPFQLFFLHILQPFEGRTGESGLLPSETFSDVLHRK